MKPPDDWANQVYLVRIHWSDEWISLFGFVQPSNPLIPCSAPKHNTQNDNEHQTTTAGYYEAHRPAVKGSSVFQGEGCEGQAASSNQHLDASREHVTKDSCWKFCKKFRGVIVALWNSVFTFTTALGGAFFGGLHVMVLKETLTSEQGSLPTVTVYISGESDSSRFEPWNVKNIKWCNGVFPCTK